ncbi:hypothetical protein FSARC_3901 [Fusarium sarcochroum]|uniref:Peptidase S33 tripeptidyl aminopeptidase-like C-terminal domain-containing protein n=1 Tax=Fusarium sarcochroum TaxID=1208366 RepID=A0A8H4U320_9HYPO|nr:hypothetical protein FSARC_3901 [Fusarium sarcochroum]
MKPQNIILSHLLLQSVQAATVSNDEQLIALTSGSTKKSNIDWARCDLDFGHSTTNQYQAAYDCARLEVPLDYTNQSSPDTLKLDLIKAKATRKPFEGSVLFNSGGPGRSGVESIVARGAEYVEILGGHYDIIGFDPRGTGRTLRPTSGNSIERVLIESNTPSSKQRSKRDEHGLFQIDTRQYVNSTLWQSAGRLAEECYKDNADVGRFYGTPFVARDMISIVDALGQGDKINFWGISYGSVLGQVVAGMFPARIGRMMIDSNLLINDYLDTAGHGSTQDAEKAFLHFIDECIAAGPELCSLAGNGTTAESLLKAIDKQIRGGIDFDDTPKFEGNSAIYSLILRGLRDVSEFPNLDATINAILQGDGTAIDSPLETDLMSSAWSSASDLVYLMVFCGDSSFRAKTPDDIFSLYQAHLTAGPFAPSTMREAIYCARWKFQAVEQVDLNSLRNIKTANPVLIINGAYDPVTPAAHAWEISARMQGSRVVIHEGVGHGFVTHPSECVNDIVAKYFNDGELPEINTTCKPDTPAFEYAEYAKSKAWQDAAEAGLDYIG